MPLDRKEAIRKYKETPRTMGVYAIRNTASGKTFVGSATDAPARLNRHRAALQLGSHPSRPLQQEWNRDGAESFAFEVVDTLKPSDDAGSDPAEDLRVLEAMWREKLSSSTSLYN